MFLFSSNEDQVLIKCVLILLFPVYDIHTCVVINLNRAEGDICQRLSCPSLSEMGKYIQMSKIDYFALTLQSIPISFFLLITQLF